jgi:predicted GIY-YIG superfamily endonuclease
MKKKQWVIYTISAADGVVVYVGCTRKLKSRILQHKCASDNRELRAWIRSRPCPPPYAIVGLINDRNTALDVEGAYIRSLLPEFNKNAGPGSRTRSGTKLTP